MSLEVGAIVEGKVKGITNFGAFVELPEGKTGMVHISEVAKTYVSEIREYVKENQRVKVKIISISDDGRISLSMKKAMEDDKRPKPAPAFSGRPADVDFTAKKENGLSFEDMMLKFKQSSDEKISVLKRKNNDIKRTRKGSPVK